MAEGESAFPAFLNVSGSPPTHAQTSLDLTLIVCTLQIHFMDVGQGDGAILISPGGETVLFDNGVRNNCDNPVSYLQQLGITQKSVSFKVFALGRKPSAFGTGRIGS